MASTDSEQEPSTSKTPSIRFRLHTSLSSQMQACNQVTTKALPDNNEEPFLIATSITKTPLSMTTSSHRHSSSFTTSSISSTTKIHLLSYSEIPEWMKDNDCLKKGYRPPLGDTLSCLKSIFSFHTETMNIWTHLLGCSVFILLAAYINYKYYHYMTWKDMIIFGVYFTSVIGCLALSSTFHIFNCHSKDIFLLCKRFDYCGISLLISGSCIAWTYYAFYTDVTNKAIYLSIAALVGLTVALVSLLERFGHSDFRAIRATVYIVFGLSAALPVIHYIVHEDYVPISFFSMFSFGIYYILGGVIYALRIPEKFFPGKFDILFHSHQIFHVLIIIAAWIHLNNIREIAFLRIHPSTPSEVLSTTTDSTTPGLIIGDRPGNE